MAKEKWMVQAKKADFATIAEKYGIDQVTARLLRNRDLVSDEEIKSFLYGEEDALHDGSLMSMMDLGNDIILDSIKNKKRIRIIGDYDIDGVTSTYILFRGISALGGMVDYAIPDRIGDGYGLNVRLIEDAKSDGIESIITCDNGIAAMDAIERGKELGLTIVVTDHHNVPYETLPNGERRYLKSKADAIIDPKSEGDKYPFPEICGAVVAYKFISKLTEKAKYIDREPLLRNLIQYAAIGTIGDIMELRDENRAIVKMGLKEIHRTSDTGLSSLIKACKIDREAVNTFHIGFVIGPCINASGRLRTAEMALKLLLCENEEEAMEMATDLVDLNNARKELTEKYTLIASEQVESSSLMDDKVLVCFLPDCHESIAGIIAGRIRERYGKPTLVVTRGEEGLKGSGRSIPAYHMYDAMNEVADIFTKFGGHSQAAGFSLPEYKLNDLRRGLNERCRLTDEDMKEVVRIDMVMPPEYASEKLIREFDLLAPFGQGNPSPLFAEKDLEIINIRILGRERKVIRMKLKTVHGNIVEGISFMDPEELRDFLGDKFGNDIADRAMSGGITGAKISICYVPEINEFNGVRSIQLKIRHLA